MQYERTFKPYIINAFYTWCMDINLTPLIEIIPNAEHNLPAHVAKNSPVVLNIHPNSVRNLILGKDVLEFQALFSGIAQTITIPYDSVRKIYAREDGYGLEFEVQQHIFDPHKNMQKPHSKQVSQIKKKNHLTLVTNDKK